ARAVPARGRSRRAADLSRAAPRGGARARREEAVEGRGEGARPLPRPRPEELRRLHVPGRVPDPGPLLDRRLHARARALARLSPDSTDLRHARAGIELARGELEKAIADERWNVARPEGPRTYEHHALLGHALDRALDEDGALAELQVMCNYTATHGGDGAVIS